MFKSLLEPFAVSPADAASQEELRYYYGDKRPNAVLSGQDRDIPLAGPTTTYLGDILDETVANYRGQKGGNRRESPLEDKYLMPNNSLTKGLLSARQSACEGLGSARDQFAHLSDMAANVDPKSRMRCGWIYNATDPNQGRGAYGTIDGPVVESSASGTWMWDLQAAKKKFHISICSTAKNCADVDNSKYAGRCGFCTTSKKIIPITGSVAAYPYEGTNACASSSIVISSGSCPKPKPPPPAGSPAAAKWNAERGTCDPLSNGAIPRDCLIQTAKQAGCSDSGTLITALKGASDTNYLDTLSQASSYSLYQQRAAVGFNETALKSGKITVSDALTEFQGLEENASSSSNMGLQAAAADLCFTKGSYENYDFCTELLPTSKGPFAVDCLQKAFLRAGGQQTGGLYPTSQNLQEWNSYPYWSDVTAAIQKLLDDCSSLDRSVQQDAIGQFYGIPLEDRTAPLLGLIPNVEIFWFTPDTNIKSSTAWSTTFLGRRIRSQIPYLGGTSGLPSGLGSGAFVFFTNMQTSSEVKFDIRFNGDSGFIFSANKPMVNDYNTYDAEGHSMGYDTTNKELSSLYPVFGNPQSEMSTSSPWTIKPNTPNIITGYYMGNGTNFRINYIQRSSVPQECGCYGSPSTDRSIRIYKEDECKTGLNGNWYSNGECIKKTGGSWSATCAGLNSQDPCANTWGFFPGNMLYLIQDPYAPMVSFNVLQNYQTYSCDYPMCDKRLGSHKMKLAIYQRTGPVPNYVGTSTDTNKFTLRKSFMKFNNGAGMMSLFLMPMYSFMTMIFMVRFNTVPAAGAVSAPFVFWPITERIDHPSVLLFGKGNNTAQLCIGTEYNQTSKDAIGPFPAKSSDGPTITTGKTYIITVRSVRKTESDYSSLYAMQIGAATVSELQKNPSALKESSLVVWEPSRLVINGIASFLLIRADASTEYDLFSIQMFDYNVTGDNLKHVAKNDWAIMPGSIYN